jgi:serine/threonine protein kinase
VTETDFLLTLGSKNSVVMMDVEGTVKGAFAGVESPTGLLHLPKFDHVAVASKRGSGSIFFFDMEDYREQGTLITRDAAHKMSMYLGAEQPRFLAAGEFDNELIFTTSSKVMRACVPLPDSDCDSSARNRILVSSGTDFWGVGALLSKGTLIVVDRKSPGSGVLYECSLTFTNLYYDQCTVFASEPENTMWDPMALLVDEDKQMMYVSDNQFASVHVFGFDGSYGGHVEEMKGFLTSPSSLAMKPGEFNARRKSTPLLFRKTNPGPPSPGPFATISPVSHPSAATAGVPIVSSITLRTHLDLAIATDFPIESETYRYQVSAEGLIPGTEFTTKIHGAVAVSGGADDQASLTASVSVPYSGSWTVSITEGLLNPQSLLGSPFVVVVGPAPTDPASCASAFTSEVVAGTDFSVSVLPMDAFLNPTAHASDSFYGELSGSEHELERVDDEFSYSKTLAAAGEYDFLVFHTATGTQIVNSPFHFKVTAASPSADWSSHNIANKAGVVRTVDTSSASDLVLQVFPKDKYLNPIADAAGYEVAISGLDDSSDGTYELRSASNFLLTIVLPKGLRTTVVLKFMYEGNVIGDGKEVRIPAAPAEPLNKQLYIGGAAAVFVVFCIAFYMYYRRSQRLARLLGLEVEQISHQKSEVDRQRLSLHRENQNLQESLRKKKHSDEELEVMKKALQDLSQARSDELKECLIDSKEVKVDRLLGKGGFGVVNLATYRGQLVAQKQLLTINDESVKRFRFECFLMKSLRHPNIVKLIGVCWDDNLFACCLEFVENGSLEDWLKKARGKHHKDMSWKTHLLKTAQECALGVEYLHNERYWAEEEVDEEGTKIDAGWRECIIHRDLKPDNMLLTTDWTLKLTDFGEARAVQLNQTMTSVGTPIYVAPEVMKGYRYDSTADSYSFGICLVAMIRGEKNIMEFYFESLRKFMKRKNRGGVGITILNQRMYTQKWRPLLPLAFEKGYPKLCALIKECWSQDMASRPSFKDIVRRLHGNIDDEIKIREEPEIMYLSKMKDELYWEQMKLEAKGGIVVFGDEDGEDGSAVDTTKFVSRREFSKVLDEMKEMVSRKDYDELRERADRAERELQTLRGGELGEGGGGG